MKSSMFFVAMMIALTVHGGRSSDPQHQPSMDASSRVVMIRKSSLDRLLQECELETMVYLGDHVVCQLKGGTK